MKVLVIDNMLPFCRGGAKELCRQLVRNLCDEGVDAEAMQIPFSFEPAERLVEEIVLCRSLRLWNVDRVIALQFPSYHVPFHEKVLWVLGQYRPAYDLWDAGQSSIANDARGREIRRLVQENDTRTFASAKGTYAISHVAAERMRRYNGVQADVLMFPLNDPESFVPGEYGDYILAAGPVNAGNRQWLLIEAMRHLPPGIRLVIAGPPDRAQDVEDLKARIIGAGLEHRVMLDLRTVPRGELASLVNNARAVACVPCDEDLVGDSVAQACHAARAVVTTTDSGDLPRIVVAGETGCVGAPDPESLAAAMGPLLGGTADAARLGRQAQAHWKSLNVTWPATVERLLS